MFRKNLRILDHPLVKEKMQAGRGRFELAQIFSMIGSIERPNMNNSEQIVEIPVEMVLSEAWDPTRLENALRLSNLGMAPPAICVGAIEVDGVVFYDISNGNHRTEACRILGCKTILAKIECICSINRENLHWFRGNRTWMLKVKDCVLIYKWSNNDPEFFFLVDIGYGPAGITNKIRIYMDRLLSGRS